MNKVDELFPPKLKEIELCSFRNNLTRPTNQQFKMLKDDKTDRAVTGLWAGDYFSPRPATHMQCPVLPQLCFVPAGINELFHKEPLWIFGSFNCDKWYKKVSISCPPSTMGELVVLLSIKVQNSSPLIFWDVPLLCFGHWQPQQTSPGFQLQTSRTHSMHLPAPADTWWDAASWFFHLQLFKVVLK